MEVSEQAVVRHIIIDYKSFISTSMKSFVPTNSCVELSQESPPQPRIPNPPSPILFSL
ncbi:hypothetical protein HanIR_Chr06g0291981 [Helianthus annuus]|nr:hypothetical protein HanIR_Chr06g0291981 [Helianthus annuus]